MPILTWKSYATKVRKKPKSDFHEYTRAEALGIPRKAKHCDSDGQSWEGKIEEEKKEELKVTRSRTGTPHAGACQASKSSVMEMSSFEQYQKVDDEIETHLKEKYGQETETGLRSSLPSSGSISSKKRSVKSGSSSSSNRKEKVRSKKNGKDGSCG